MANVTNEMNEVNAIEVNSMNSIVVSYREVLNAVKEVLDDSDGLPEVFSDALILDSIRLNEGFNGMSLSVLAYALDPSHVRFNEKIEMWARAWDSGEVDSDDLAVYELIFSCLNGHDLFIEAKEATIMQFGCVVESEHPLDTFTLARIDFKSFVRNDEIDLGKLEDVLTIVLNGGVV